VLSAILCGAGFFEAMVNELFQDAMDGHAPEGSGVAPLSDNSRALMLHRDACQHRLLT
jgi:hypothetical protein